MTPRRLVPLALACLLAACGSSATDAGDPVGGTLDGVGVAPPSVEGSDAAPLTLPLEPGTFPDGAPVPVADTPVGDRALGNRLILIGDSITASVSPRYGGEACATLVPLGWRVEVEAESGRFAEFGSRVLDALPPDQWDAAVVFLGTNYDGDEAGYETELAAILDDLAPRPVVVVTTTLFRDMQTEVNSAIARQIAGRDHVDVVDWATISTTPGALAGDGIHLTDAGRQLYVDALALALGQAPVEPGECLSSRFTEDLPVAGAPGGPGGITTVPGGGSPSATAPATAPATSPTTGTAPGTEPPATTSPPATVPTTAAPTTAAPTATTATLPPTTAAPTTAAPTTAAPTTAAPTTAPTTAAPTTAAPTTAAPTTAAPVTAAPATAAPATTTVP